MSSFNSDALLDEGRRLVVLAVASGVVTAVVLFLDKLGGHLAAGLGVLAASLAVRLLLVASRTPSVKE